MLSSTGSGMTPTLGFFISPERLNRLVRPRRSTDILSERPHSDVSHVVTGSGSMSKDRASSLGAGPEDEERTRTMQHLWWHERQRQIDAKRRSRTDSGTTTTTTTTDDDEDETDFGMREKEPVRLTSVPEVTRTAPPDGSSHSKRGAAAAFGQIKKTLTPEIMRRRRGRRQASHGDVLSMPELDELDDRRQSAPGDGRSHHTGFGHFKDILRRHTGRRSSSHGHIRSARKEQNGITQKTIPEVCIAEPEEGHTKTATSGFSQLKKTLTPEIIRRRRGRRQASHGDVLSLPEVGNLADRRQSAPGTHGYQDSHTVSGHVKDILRKRKGRLRLASGGVLLSLPEMQCVDDDEDERCSQLSGEPGTSVSDLVAGVVMEQKLTSYRVHMASSKAILNLEADAMLLDGDEIILEDEDGNDDPRSETDTRLRNVYRMLKTEKHYQEALRSVFDVYAEPLRKFSSLSKEDHRVLFFGLEPLLSLSATLVLKLEDVIQQWDDASTVGNLFSKQFWHHYDEYYQNYKDIRCLLREKRETEEEFVQFCQLRRGAARHSLESLLLLPGKPLPGPDMGCGVSKWSIGPCLRHTYDDDVIVTSSDIVEEAYPGRGLALRWVQRIPAYAGYLSELLEDTDHSHPDYDDLSKAAAKVKSMVKEREGDLNVAENELKVETVQDRFPFDDLGLHDREKYMKMKALQSRRRSAPGAMILRSLSKKQGSGTSTGLPPLFPDLANASKSSSSNLNRVYVVEGPAQLTTGLQTQDRYLFLFNDLLLVAKQKSSTTFKLKQRTRVCEMWMADCLDEVSETTRAPERSFVIGWPTTNMVATFTTPDIKELWYSKLKEQIASEKSKEHPKTAILRILNNEMEEYPTSKALAVTNYEQAQEVVKRCLDEFHIADGKPKDYQLWVLSGKEESPYPLIGHEQPYSIKMNHLRDATRGPDDPPLDVDANDNSIQCQFVLRQAKKDPKTSLDGPDIKRNKKSKKLMSFFKKSTSKHDVSPPTAPLGKLFGHSLCAVSEEDAIPKPIMGMLHRLFLIGPYTTGIFRKTANQRCLRELREKLDAEETVNWDEVPVLSIAGIFKVFLRNLPDCLLLSDMYDNWIDIVEIQDDSQKVEKVKKTLEQLHKPHVNLLRHTICLLHHIKLQSESNQMNASNLAICIGQSLLFPPASSGTPNQTGTKKVTELIQFVIEHVTEVFGDDVVLLFGEPPETKPRQDSSTDSDSMHSLLSLADNGPRRDDSSLDSLDRDLYISEMESPKLMNSHRSNTNLSRDSGLTLSDTQLYTDDGSETNEYPRVPASPQKPHQYVRSVSSQLEEQHQHHHQKFSSSDMLSRSCDGTLEIADHPPPVPPPRKNRRRGAETPPGEQTPPGPLAHAHVQAMRHTVSASQMSSSGYHNRHAKTDILSDLEENQAAEEYIEIQRIVHDQEESAILHKSESGACLYMDNEVVHRSLPGQQHFVLGEDSPMRQVTDLSASYSGVSTSPLVSPASGLSSSYPNSSSQVMMFSSNPVVDTVHLPVIPDHPPPPYNANHKTIPTPTSQPPLEVSPEPAPPLPPRQTSLSLPHEQSPHHSPETVDTPPPATQQSPSKKILRNQFQKDPTVLRKVQKGMTPTGADIFPKHMRSMMRHSLQEEEMRRAVVAAKDRTPLRKQHTAEPYQRPETQAERNHVVMQLRNMRAVEKSASDSNILDTFQPGQESSPRKVSDATADQWQRPDKPPSYQEAIKRKSLIQSGVLRYEATETELIQQRQNNQRAKQLYEESMKKYLEENDDNKPPPPTSEASGKCAQSLEAEEQIYETMTYTPEKAETEVEPSQELGPKHICEEKMQEQLPSEQKVHIDNRDLHSSTGRRGGVPQSQSNCVNNVQNVNRKYSQEQPQKHRDSGSRESTPVRRNHSHERTSRESRNNNQNERPKSRSKSRDKRHGHRSSDTRLENSRTREDKEFRHLCSNLSRSKSDSHEHLNKIAHFKELKPLDNNIIEKCKRAKIEDFRMVSDGQSNMTARPKSQSVKNKDWHRELAEKYNQVFYQPTSVQPNKTVPHPQYAYIKSTKQEANENERPKRRWTPPVHPTKDLIIKNEGEVVRTRKNTPPRTIVKSENDFRNGQQYENSRKNMVAEKENRPTVTEHKVMNTEPVAPECEFPDQGNKDFTTTEPDTISWSVARLRNLYDDSKPEGGEGSQGPFYSPDREGGSRPPPPPYRHPPPATRSSTKRRSPNEKTNPEAEESYV